jgi:hypothetical protein
VAEAAEVEADEDEDSSSEDDDVALDDSWQQFEGADEQQLLDADDEAGPASAAADAEDATEGGDEAIEQLPQSVVEALQTHSWPSNKGQRQQQKQQGAQQGQDSSSEQQPKQQQQRPQQQEQRTEPLRLSETNPMYLPVLTDEDLENDPPGHKSGYVAVIGRPNAGERW